MWRGKKTPSSKARAPPRECPTIVTCVALCSEIVFWTADKISLADLVWSVISRGTNYPLDSLSVIGCKTMVDFYRRRNAREEVWIEVCKENVNVSCQGLAV
jgi:hypothetical protein